MLEKNIKKSLIEEKERRQKLLVEQNIVKSRVMLIFESKDKINNYELLTEDEKFDLSRRLFLELKEINEIGILSEQLMDYLKQLFGNSFSAITQTFIEPLVRKALSHLGITGYLSNVVVSFVTRNPMEFIKGLSDCNIMSKLIVNSLIEGLVMSLQDKFASQGSGWTFIRNAMVEILEDSSFNEKLVSMFTNPICEVLRSVGDKVKNVTQKLAPSSPI